MKTALFLGAGASVFASQPTTKDIMDLVRERVRERKDEPHRKENLQNYVMNLVKAQIYSDVEKLYDGIEHVIDTCNSHCQPIISNVRDNPHNVSYEQIIDELNHLLSVIREILLKSFVISADDHKSIKRMYDMVWKVMEDNETEEFQIFTTNYDIVMEKYCKVANLDLVNGFTSHSYLNKIWANEWTAGAANSIYLTKLHGSINWHKDADGNIVETGGIEQRDAHNDIMIAPTEGTKRYDKKPFSALMNRFSVEIRKVDVLLVIGFSYRDETIVNIIRDRVRDGMALISVSPDAAKDIRAVSNSDDRTINVDGQQIKIVDERIILCEQKFEQDTITSVCDTLNAAYRYLVPKLTHAVKKQEGE